MILKHFLHYLQQEKRYSEKTLVSYKTDLEQFMDHVGSTIPGRQIADLDGKDVRNWVVHLVRDRGLQPSTVRRKLSAVNTYFNFLVRREGLAKNPARDIAPLKLPRKIPQFLNERSMEAMVNGLGEQGNAPGALRASLLIDLLYLTGMRRQELIDLKWSDLDEGNMRLKITGKGNKQRLVPVSRDMMGRLSAYKKDCCDRFGQVPEHLFTTDKGNKLYPKFVYNLVRNCLSSYSTLDKRSPHILRHTFATHLLNNGADLNDIKELLGHASLAATQVYTHNSIEELKNIYKQAHPKS